MVGYYHGVFCYFSLLAGAADGVIVVYDLHNLGGEPKYTFPMVCSAGKSNRYRHKKSIETVQWFPIDTGMFLSSGTDKILKVWDTNVLKVCFYCKDFILHNFSYVLCI